MRKLLRIIGIIAAVLVGLAVLGGGLFAFEVLSRRPLRSFPSTTHASIPDKGASTAMRRSPMNGVGRTTTEV